ncbi:hypothetical protein PG2011B_1302, partial [Bifidobacterium animalis subsp. lactis]
DHAKHWTGPSQANGSSNFSMPWNTLNKAYNHKDVLQRPLESAMRGGGSVFALAIAVAIVVRRRAKTPAWSACTLSMYRATMFIVRNKTMRQPDSLPAHRLY